MLKLLIRNGSYRRYWSSLWLSNLGDWIRNMALMYIVLKLSHNSSRAVAVNMFCEFAPMFLAPFIGVFADRWNRKWTYVLATAARMLVILGVSIGVSFHLLVVIYVGALLGSIGTVLVDTASGGLVSEMVSMDDRKSAASLSQWVYSAMTLIGAPLGTGIYMLIGGTASLWISAGLFLVTVLITAMVRVDGTERSGVDSGVRSILVDIADGFRYAKRNPVMKPILVTAWIAGLMSGLVNVLEVFVVTEFLRLPRTMLSVVLAVQGIGMVVSVPVVQKLKIETERLLPIGLVSAGIGLGVMVAYPQILVTSVGYLFISASNVGISIAIGTLVRTRVDIEYQGREFSIFTMVQMGMMGIAMLAAGWMHGHFSAQTLVLASGAIAFIGGMSLFLPIERLLNTPNEVKPSV